MTMTSIDIQRARQEQEYEDMDLPRCGVCRSSDVRPGDWPSLCLTCPGTHIMCRSCQVEQKWECEDPMQCPECGNWCTDGMVLDYCSEACAYGDYADETCASCDRVLRYRIVRGKYCSAYCEYVDREVL